MTNTSTIDVSTIINESRISSFQYWVVAICALTVFLDGFDTQIIAFVAPAIVKEWSISRDALGPIFVASLFGLLIGALVFGPIADRIGRRRVLLICTAVFAVLSVLTGFTSNTQEMLLLRFLTGLGLGGAMPNAISLTAEYCPTRRRATLVMIMFTGFSLGSAVGGLLASAIITTVGWRAVFFVGGSLPLLLLPVQYAALPDSLRFLVISGAPQETLRRLVARVAPDYPIAANATIGSTGQIARGVPVAHLFHERLAAGTLLLWSMFFLNLLALYFLQNWLPILLADEGVSLSQAVFIGSLFQVGGVAAALFTGTVVDRYSGYVVMPVLYGAACLVIAALGQVGGTIAIKAVVVFVAGFCVVGAQNCANAHAAIFYPTAIRSTGVGWCLGIGRTGAIVGPLLAGGLIALHWPVGRLFSTFAIPLALALVAVLAMGALYRTGTRASLNEAGPMPVADLD